MLQRKAMILALGWLPLLGGCAAMDGAAGMVPREAVMAAADAAPRGVSGMFAMLIQASGRDGARVYLNSELDYRDQRNVTVEIAPSAAAALARRYGSPPDQFFKGKAIQVLGQARRTRIDFTGNGKPTGKYYYQTHVVVTSPDQLWLVGPRRR